MEGAMAAIAGAPNECSSLQFRRKTELMRRTSTSTIWRVHVCGSSFSDGSHLQYYRGIAYCSNENKSQKQKSKPPGRGGDFLRHKKKITLLEGLCKDLLALSNSNGEPPVDGDGDGASLADQVRGRILSDALEVVLRQLAQAKAERKERKRQLKAQKKALKARKDESSSSSSSSSSGSSQQENYALLDSLPSLRTPAILMKNFPGGVRGEGGLHLEFGRTADRLAVAKVVAEQQQPSGDKIEVCMGTKCKRMGSEELLEAFEGYGGRVEAVGCKCMGKCKSAPNVRVRRLHSHGHDGLHLGVAIADVDSIVSHHFGAVVPA